MLCELLKAGDICVHGPVIPGAGTREATLDAVGGSAQPLLPFSPVLKINSLGREFTFFYVTKHTHGNTHIHTHKREELL